MNMPGFSVLLARHPNLQDYLEHDKFMLGYALGSEQGGIFSVFLLNSPWRDYCLQATASEAIPSGGVIVVTHEEPWKLQGVWQAYYWDYSLEMDKKTAKLASLAVEISLKSPPRPQRSRIYAY